ncbi:hypothetical protein COX08_02000, partial [Candidatus Beckwithbacteria bacterium CG23_combo_of_CG06-09_8_20_14_all_34_8]
ILIAEYNNDFINPNPEEVDEYQWMSWDEAIKFSSNKKNLIAPWWEIAIEQSMAKRIKMI